MSTIRKILVLTMLAGLTGLAACATPEERAASDAEKAAEMKLRKGEQVNRICFASGIDGFSNNDRRSVVLTKSQREKYLVETSICQNLDTALALDIDNRTGCVTRGDYLITFDSAFPQVGGTGASDRCLITAIYEWKTDYDLEQEEMADM